MNGWMGNLLRVNLTDGSYAIESSEKYFAYIGGKGMANRIIYGEVPAGTDPVSPENKIVFAVGPNTGSSAPCSGPHDHFDPLPLHQVQRDRRRAHGRRPPPWR